VRAGGFKVYSKIFSDEGDDRDQLCKLLWPYVIGPPEFEKFLILDFQNFSR
jgi:hypothetical protein